MHEAFHEVRERAGQAPPPGRAGGVGEGPVLVDETLDDRVVAQPAAGLGRPTGQARQWAVVEYPRLAGQFVLLAEDQCGQGPPAEVGGADWNSGGRSIQLVIETAMSQSVELPDGEGQGVLVPNTDAGLELTLAVLSRQISACLFGRGLLRLGSSDAGWPAEGVAGFAVEGRLAMLVFESGMMEKPVIRSKFRWISLYSGYFDSPAKRTVRS